MGYGVDAPSTALTSRNAISQPMPLRWNDFDQVCKRNKPILTTIIVVRIPLPDDVVATVIPEYRRVQLVDYCAQDRISIRRIPCVLMCLNIPYLYA